MKKNTKTTRLSLNYQTLREIGRAELRRVAAGMDGTGRDPSCLSCDPSMPTVCPGPTPP